MQCINEHDNHGIIYYNKIMPNKEVKMNEKKELRRIIDILKKDIYEIIIKLNIVKENIEIYNNICDIIINNYNIKNRNYQILQNINGIINNDIIKDIDNIINKNNRCEL